MLHFVLLFSVLYIVGAIERERGISHARSRQRCQFFFNPEYDMYSYTSYAIKLTGGARRVPSLAVRGLRGAFSGGDGRLRSSSDCSVAVTSSDFNGHRRKFRWEGRGVMCFQTVIEIPLRRRLTGVYIPRCGPQRFLPLYVRNSCWTSNKQQLSLCLSIQSPELLRSSRRSVPHTR